MFNIGRNVSLLDENPEREREKIFAKNILGIFENEKKLHGQYGKKSILKH